MGQLLSAQNLVIGYRRGQAILPPISFSVQSGQVTSVVGHNGSGKSTLLRTMLGLLSPLSGQLKVASGARIGYVPQRESMDPIYPVRVEELVETGRYVFRGAGKWLTAKDRKQVEQAMHATGIASFAQELFRNLSGGQQQRVLLARALCVEPQILILDEPTASLDEKGAAEVMRLTLELARKRDAAVVMVNHFIDLVADISDQVVALDRDHQKVQIGTPADIFSGRGGKGGTLYV